METKELAKQLGISHQLCNRHKKRGMPCDSLEAAIKWRKNNLAFGRTKSSRIDSNPGKHTNETQASNSKPIEDLKQEVNAAQLDLEVKNAETLYRNARALRLKAEALQATAEHEKFIGTLIERKVVEKFVFESSRQFRDGLLTCARRIAPEIACMKDINEIETALSREFRALLENFVKMMEAERTKRVL